MTKVKRSLVTAGRIGPQLSALGSDVQPKRDHRSPFGALVLPVLENEIEGACRGSAKSVATYTAAKRSRRAALASRDAFGVDDFAAHGRAERVPPVKRGVGVGSVVPLGQPRVEIRQRPLELLSLGGDSLQLTRRYVCGASFPARSWRR